MQELESDLRVRYRIDGVLHEVDTVPRAVQSALISRLKIMANVDITERRVPQNGRITVYLLLERPGWTEGIAWVVLSQSGLLTRS